MRYIALLRGINVGGNNKVSMKVLKEAMETRGYKQVLTYINSGNIIFTEENGDIQALRSDLEALLKETFQLDIPVLILTAEELQEALKNAPDWWDADKEAKHNALFVLPPTTVEEVFEAVGEIKPQYEKVSSYGKVIFWTAPLKTFSRTRWSRIVEKSIYSQVTIRNANTAKKLMELCH